METILKAIKEQKAQFVDLRFTDTLGKEQHATVPASIIDQNFLKNGKMFDGSSMLGWKNIAHSDMILMPDPQCSPHLDPFCEKPTLVLRCDVIEPSTMSPYGRDPRSIAKRAEAYLKETGIADTCYFGPEPEFFIFDSVRWTSNMHSAFYFVDSQEAAWNSGTKYMNGNLGHRPSVKGGYFPVPPVDSSQDIRSVMCEILEKVGIPVEVHHHEVGAANQNEIGTKFNSLCLKADQLMMFKYIIFNVAHNFGKTATFMPKPLVGENGNGMHCHQSLAKDGRNLFAGEEYAGLSELAFYYMGGIIKHARALNAFTNPATNSYKRLVPGFEAPVMLAYSSRNRSAAIRIPFVSVPKDTRIEVRFPDPLANPYLAFSAMMMAGLDGILNKIRPGEPMDTDLYELSPKEAENIPTVCHSLDQAMYELEKDHAFLLKGNVFSMDMLEGYMEIKQNEIARLRMATHPIEFDMYYSL